jgi:hypothetical protein
MSKLIRLVGRRASFTSIFYSVFVYSLPMPFEDGFRDIELHSVLESYLDTIVV